jgi:hypothetical protein
MTPDPMIQSNKPVTGHLRGGMSLFYMLATFVTGPAELAIRLRTGSLYIHPLVMGLSYFGLNILWLVSLLAEPAIRISTGLSERPIGMGWIYTGYIVLLAVHIPRITRRMRHMELEEYSESDGDPWPVMHLLPRPTWTMIRCVYEPALLALGSVLLMAIGILEPFAMAYLVVVGLCLACRQACRLYADWLRRRELADIAFLFRLAQRIADGNLQPGDLKHIPQGRVPDSPEERKRLACSLSPDFAKLVTK